MVACYASFLVPPQYSSAPIQPETAEAKLGFWELFVATGDVGDSPVLRRLLEVRTASSPPIAPDPFNPGCFPFPIVYGDSRINLSLISCFSMVESLMAHLVLLGCYVTGIVFFKEQHSNTWIVDQPTSVDFFLTPLIWI